MIDTDAPLLCLCRDLIFQSRITAAARSAGRPVVVIRNADALGMQPGRLLVVDLNQQGAIDAAASWKSATAGRVVGFVSHVDAATAKGARDAGITEVLARSRFVELLDTLLA